MNALNKKSVEDLDVKGKRVLVQERRGDRPAHGLIPLHTPLSAACEPPHGLTCGLFFFDSAGTARLS